MPKCPDPVPTERANLRPIAFFCLAVLLLLPAVPAGAQERTPIVFIPGMMGSYLVEKNNPGKIVWGKIQSSVDRFAEIELPPDPKKIALIAGKLIMKVGGDDQYNLLVDPLKQLGYEEGRDLFLFGYDWRISNFETALRFRDYLEKNELLDRDIVLMGHSMGGLVATIYMQTFPELAERVKTFVTFGTPFYGSVDAVQALMEGFAVVGVSNSSVVPAGNVSLVYKVFSSLDTIYELLPTYQGCCFARTPEEPDKVRELNMLDLEPWYRLNLFLAEKTRRREGHKFHLREAFFRLNKVLAMVQMPLPERTKRVVVYSTASDKTTLRMVANGNGPGKHVWEKVPGAGDSVVIKLSAKGSSPEDTVLIPSSERHQILFGDPSVWQKLAPHL